MRKLAVLILGIALSASQGMRAERAIIDDDAYVDGIIESSARLARQHELLSVEALRKLVRTKGMPLKLQPVSKQKPSPADLCDRLRESTLAVGTYYKCPDCGEWHFNGSAGFMVAEGMLCTCCHVVVGLDAGVTEAYLVAADASGRVFPVKDVLAADTESDTCLLSIEAPGLKPLPIRTNVRPGERVYCLSHPGGYYFMFTQGLVARLNRRPNEIFDESGHTNGLLTRPILFLNVTAEFAPGSSGAPVVDESGNVVGQVASIADAGDPRPGDTNAAPSPSVPVRFCTASEELLRMTDPGLRKGAPSPSLKPPGKSPGHRLARGAAPAHGLPKIRIGPDHRGFSSLLPAGARHYSGFRPERQAKFPDFIEIHFYPLAKGAYEYRGEEDELANLAYLEGVVREAARPGKPVVLAEFGWYGGGKPGFDHGAHPAASEEQQARYCRRVVETSAGYVTGWLNWGFYDQPEATDCSELTGLVMVGGMVKAWGRSFQELTGRYGGKKIPVLAPVNRPTLDWDACVTSAQAGGDKGRNDVSGDAHGEGLEGREEAGLGTNALTPP